MTLSSNNNEKARWLDASKFTLVAGPLFRQTGVNGAEDGTNVETHMNRNALRSLAAPSSDEFFDLCTTTLATLNRMYLALSVRWGENHPLLRHDVRLARLRERYRAFHRYASEAIRAMAENVNFRGETMQAASMLRLRDTIREDRARAADMRVRTERLRDEVTQDEAEVRALEQLLHENSYKDAIEYVNRLIVAKRARIRVLRDELKRQRAGADQPSSLDELAYNRQLEEALLSRLDEGLRMIAELRDQVGRTPILFRGVPPREQLNAILPQWPAASLPGALLSLYTQLYGNVNESVVRRLLEEM